MTMNEKTHNLTDSRQIDTTRLDSALIEEQTSIVESHIVIKDPESGEIIMSRRD